MVSIGISCCFVILFAYTRPYIGQFAIGPDDLNLLLTDIAADSATPTLRQADAGSAQRR
jgi:hypothetical protein